jgi:hypothetical protein
MLLVQSLRSGADKKQAHDASGNSTSSQGVYNDLHAGYVEAGDSREGLRSEPVSSLDLRREPLDLGEPFMQNTEFTELKTQAGDGSDGAAGKDEQLAGSTSGPGAASINTELADGDVQNLDELSGLDVDLIAAELMTDDAQNIDELPSLAAHSVGDVELPADNLQDMDSLANLDAAPADTALLADDARGHESVAALAYTEVWLIPGPYSGRGPIGYDSAGDPTGQEVYSRLTQHGQVDASEIEIVIDDGEVLLDGTVDSEETKRLAQEAVETITGVRSVQNLLQVKDNRGS